MCTVWAALFLFLSPFPFRYRFAALRSARLRRSLNLSLSFIHLSLSSSLNHVPFFFPPSPPPPPPPALPPAPIARASLRSSFPRLSVFVCPSLARRVPFLLLSLRLSRSRFFSRFFHRPRLPAPLDFSSLLCLSLLSFFRSSTTTNFSLLTPFSRAARSIYLSPFRLPLSLSLFLSTYPRRLSRRDGPIFSSRFLGSDIFYTFFLPLPLLRRLPMRRSPLPLPPAIGISPRASAPSPSLSRRTYAHGLSPSRPVYPPPFSFSHSSTSRFPLTSLSFFPAFYPPRSPTSLCLSLFCPSSTPAAPLFLIFFSQLPDHLPTPRVGVLFLSGRSSRPSARPRTRSTHVRSRSLRERERRRDKEGRKEGACGCGRKRRTEGCTRKGRVSG